jgi:hypothetical protein
MEIDEGRETSGNNERPTPNPLAAKERTPDAANDMTIDPPLVATES